jgi:hypothetical protein
MRGLDVYKWKEEIERYTLRHAIGIKREMHDLNCVAVRVGMSLKAFDNLPYGEFLDALHKQLQKIASVTT